MRYVLDTTAFSSIMKQDEDILNFLKLIQPGDVYYVPPVIAEIEYGIQRLDPSSKKRLLLTAEKNKIESVISELPWNLDASRIFGKIKAELEQRKEIIDDFDIAIGAIALSHSCAVLTSNVKHFSRIRDLSSQCWKN